MTSHQKAKDNLIQWNLRFPLDREYRKANNVIFGSEQHRAINQIDLYFQYLEDVLYVDMYNEVKEETKVTKDYKDGKLFKEQKDVEGEAADDLFAKLKIGDMSNIKIED